MTRRQTLAATLPIVVIVGLAGRLGLDGGAGDVIGGVAYTALVYVLIALCKPALRPATVGAAAFALSSAVELLQLVGVAKAFVDAWSPLRLALGEAFVATDFVAYAIGAAAAAALDARLSSQARSGHR